MLLSSVNWITWISHIVLVMISLPSVRLDGPPPIGGGTVVPGPPRGTHSTATLRCLSFSTDTQNLYVPKGKGFCTRPEGDWTCELPSCHFQNWPVLPLYFNKCKVLYSNAASYNLVVLVEQYVDYTPTTVHVSGFRVINNRASKTEEAFECLSPREQRPGCQDCVFQ
ncbi:hypothetical protein PGT21_037179 [Puccinia graminis f. sp. tritici]|uniref:Uncharacterized protein n=1 Tax=Puccinia graminis f. sp. tritici TaxID=56615 RepID=A0A5B0R5F1_PUCGR|nr:hypothetical protein PGT21_037179 [Puccinia graminis f. sp. tritici]